jgi:hypothetical protein
VKEATAAAEPRPAADTALDEVDEQLERLAGTASRLRDRLRLVLLNEPRPERGDEAVPRAIASPLVARIQGQLDAARQVEHVLADLLERLEV